MPTPSPADRPRMSSWTLLALLALSSAGLMARAAPAQWSGNASGTWVRLFVDGQKAAGGARAALPHGFAELELSGAGTGSRYSGTARGLLRSQGRARPVGGSWQADLTGGAAAITLVLRTDGASPVTRSVPVAQAAYGALRCSWLRGTATRTPAGRTPRPLRAGDGLVRGDTVETGPGSAAIVVLGDSSVVLMQERTRVQVPDTPENQERVQKVKAGTGKVWFAVQKVQSGGKFEVETDEAVASVRGTEFAVEVGEDGATSVMTAEGEVVVSLPREGKPMPVRAGMACRLPGLHFRKGPLPGPSRMRDMHGMLRTWRPLLEQADYHWPHRRTGKPRFWQDTYFRSVVPGASPLYPPRPPVRKRGNPGRTPHPDGRG